ncbi:MAG: YncE family protein [Candidatus Omnitrophota bacterium]
MVIIYMIIAMIVGSGILLLGSLDRIEANKRLFREQAFYLAEAGIDYARFKGSSWDPDPNNQFALGTGYFHIDKTGTDTITFISTGTVNGHPSAAERVQLVISAPSDFPVYPDTYEPQIPLSPYPGTIAVTPDPDGTYLYVGHFSGPGGWGTGTTVSVIERTSQEIIKIITVGQGPGGMVFSPPDGNYAYMYIANRGTDKVSVIRTSDNTVIKTINVGNSPTNLAITPDGGRVYVTNYDSNSVSVIRTSDNKVIKTIGTRNGTHAIAANPNGNYVYAANASGNSVSVIRTSDNTVIKTINVGNSPQDLKVTPDGNYVYVVNTNSDSVSVIRTSNNTVMKTISVAPGDAPVAAAITPDGKYVYVTNHGSNDVSIIQTLDNTIMTPPSPISIAPGTAPQDVVVSPDGDWVYGTNSGYTTVFVLGKNPVGQGEGGTAQWTKPDWKIK